MDKTPNAFHFKTKSDTGQLAKHYVVYGKDIDIYTLTLTEESHVDNLIKQAFTAIKSFKGSVLLVKPVHFKTSTFFTIAQGIVKLEQLKDKAQ